MELGLITPPAVTAATTALCVLLGVTVPVATKVLSDRNAAKATGLKIPPAVPGLPIVGNLHQMLEMKPHKTFHKWADTYGPVFSVKTGVSDVVVVNSPEIAEEVFGPKYMSMTEKKLNYSLRTFSNNAFIALHDYDDFYKRAKRCLMMSVLGAAAQKRHQNIRKKTVENMINRLYDVIKKDPLQEVNFRHVFLPEMFNLALEQGLGVNVDSVYVEELGGKLSKKEIFEILLTAPVNGSLEFDWRDFFPYLKWVPNWSLQAPDIAMRKDAVSKALIRDQKKRIASGQKIDCYLDFLLEEEKTWTEEQIATLIWESIAESADTTVIATEWALYEIVNNPRCQERLYSEIQDVCGSQRLSEEHIPQLPYLNAIFNETLRFHPAAPILPPRIVKEDLELGGYHVPVGKEVCVNIYGCHMDKKQWEEPEKFKPERFFNDDFNPKDLHKTLAFGGGRRACAGSLQAMHVVSLILGRFIQEFEWKLKEGENENDDSTQFTNAKLHPLLAYIKPRVK